MTMTATWTIEVGGVSRPYKTFNFARKVKMDAPTEFTATVKYDSGNPVDFFDLVNIKRNGTVEWKGFVESIETSWDEQARYWIIGGRDITVILWKKYSEDFSNFHEGTEGFFGSVNINELLKFLLRTPKSDDVYNYPNNKSGWGIDISKILEVTADRNDGYGDPEYTILRRRGLGWRNSGDPYAGSEMLVGSVVCGTGGGACDSKPQWTPHGSTPYLDDDDDTNYISAGTALAEAQFKFANFSPVDGTGVTWVYLTISWKPDTTWWWWIQAKTRIYVSWDGGTTWGFVGDFGGRNSPVGSNPWRHYSWNVSNYFNEISKLKSDNARLKLVNASGSLGMNITQAKLDVTYVKGGDQEKYERFGLSFGEKLPITGIYFESRADNESYPRNYKVSTLNDEVTGFKRDETDWDYGPLTLWFRLKAAGYVNCVPSDIGKMVKKNGGNFGILLDYDNTNRYWYTDNYSGETSDGDTMTINCGTGAGEADGWWTKNYAPPCWGTNLYLTGSQWEFLTNKQYQNAICYYYWDYDISGSPISDWNHKFGIEIGHTDPHDYAFIAYCMTNNLEDYKTMIDSNHHRVAVRIRNDGTNSKLRLETYDSAGLHYSAWSNALNTGGAVHYYLNVRRVGTNVYLWVYTDKAMSDENLWYSSGAVQCNTSTFQYRMAVVSYNGLEFTSPVFTHSFENAGWAADFTRTGGSGTAARDNVVAGIPDGSYALKIDLDQGEDYYVEKEFAEGVMNQAMVDLYVRLPSPDNEAVNNTYYPDAWVAVNNDWTKNNCSDHGCINTEDGDTTFISMVNDDANDGLYDEYYTFTDLNAKWKSIDLTVFQIGVKMRTTDGACSAGCKLYAQFENGGSWILVGSIATNSTSYTWLDATVPTAYRDDATIAKLNYLRLKIVYDFQSGACPVELGSTRITCVRMHLEGTAYWGGVTLAKLFDKDVAGQAGNPAAQIIGAVDAKIVDVSDTDGEPSKYHYHIWGYDDSGAWTETSTTQTIDSNTWVRIRMYVKIDQCDGYVKVYEINGSETLKIAKTSLDNDGRGNPDCATFEADSYDSFASTGQKSVYLDLVRIFKLDVTYTKATIEDNEFEETILASKSSNTFRDIIHSWASKEMDNIQIEITDNHADHGWSITQVYVYLAEDDDYRVMKEGDANPSFPDNQYIQAISLDDEYAPAVGPINIPKGRLIDVINKVVNICNDSYQPYEWWIAMDSSNTFHMAKRRGSDKSGSITFELGENLESSSKSSEVDDTAQRVKIIGMGEAKRQDEVSSPWEENTTAMSTVNTFYEELVTEKTVGNKEMAKLMADVFLKENADIKTLLTAEVSRDTETSMAYDVGDDVKITDSLIGIDAAKRIYNISKRVDEDGEHVTLYLGTPFKDIEERWGDIYRRLKELEFGGVISSDWASEGVEGSKLDIKQTTPFFEKTALNDEAEAGSNKTDPKWNVVYSPAGLGKNWLLSENTIGLYGCNASVGNGEDQYVLVELKYRRENTDANESQGWEQLDVALTRNPKIVFEFKPYEKSGGSPHSWNTGDTLLIGLSSSAYTEKGYYYAIEKLSGGTFRVYACWKESNGDLTKKKIRDMQANKKIRLEILVDKNRKWVIFDTYDISDPDNPAQMPISHVRIGADFQLKVFPIFMKLECTYAADCQAQAMIYKLRSEWERVGE